MRTILLAASLFVLPGAALADDATAAEHRAGSMAIGDRLVALDTPLDLKAAILCYERVIELDGNTTTANRAALDKIERVKVRLHELANSARERAAVARAAGDLIETERLLCETISIDPFDHAARVDLAIVLQALRKEADEMQRALLNLRPAPSDSLGVPPAFERIVNDPRFASPNRQPHSG